MFVFPRDGSFFLPDFILLLSLDDCFCVAPTHDAVELPVDGLVVLEDMELATDTFVEELDRDEVGVVVETDLDPAGERVVKCVEDDG